jgi:spore photoproduct lyase
MNSFSDRFRHVYIEREICTHPAVSEILAKLPKAVPVVIEQYTDVFGRPKQNFRVGHETQNLILARKHGTLLYAGAPVCHDFGSRRFFYASGVINCLYDCEYCWLKGMYASADLIVFLNTEDYFRAAEDELKNGPMYLSLSFESDLIALESLTGHVHAWSRFAAEHEGLTAEIRTKCGNTAVYRDLSASSHLVFAFTLSPASLIETMEHGTAPLSARISAIRSALEAGFPVRLCFDPMIRVPEWKNKYEGLVRQLGEELPLEKILDFSIGTYRQSDVYQRRMRRRFPSSAVIQYPYETENGFCVYEKTARTEMEQFLKAELSALVNPERIYLLEDNL